MLTPRRSSSLCRGVSFEVCCVTHTLESPLPSSNSLEKGDASVCFQRRSRPPTVPDLSSRSRGHIIFLSWESRGRHSRQQRETETEQRCIIGGPWRTMLLCSLPPPPLQTETVREKVITFWKAFPFGLEDQLLPRPHPLSPSMQFAKRGAKATTVL